MQKKLVKKPLKKIVRTLRVFSRHPTHSILRRAVINTGNIWACIRFGSETVGALPYKVEINTPQAVRNSANKLLMKECFKANNVKTADWEKCKTRAQVLAFARDRYPVVTKSLFGSRGRGNTLIHSEAELTTWLANKNLNDYIIEKFYNYSREYRLHVTAQGYFYACRKMLKQDTPENLRWFRNDSNSVWIVEQNEQFDCPVNWAACIEESVKALNAVGLDVGAVDLRIQSASCKTEGRRTFPDFIIVEINSASSFGEITSQKYIEEIPKIIQYKLNK